MEPGDGDAWARDEFGGARLGDRRRVERLVAVAAESCRRPSGTVAKAMSTASAREGAYRLVENDEISAAAIGAASHEACARRCVAEKTVIVPVDTTSLSVADPQGKRGFGPVGASRHKTRGVHVMSALAVDRTGVTLGLLAQHWWVRREPGRRRPGGRHDPRPREERESFNWVHALREATARIRETGKACTPWFQMDRGADCLTVLQYAEQAELHVTVRAMNERRIRWPDGRLSHVQPTMARQRVAGTYPVDVPERPGQVARRAAMAVRVACLPVELRVTRKHRRVVPIYFVLATEVSAPRGAKPLRWLLMTNRAVLTMRDVADVVRAYTQRWRIEEFHRAWKSGACDVERSQLRTRDHFTKWATIMAAVAARAETIKQRSRSTPDEPASVLYSRDEIEAALLLRGEDPASGERLTLAEMTRFVAIFGGYMGSKKSRPPGTQLIQRGLEYLEGAAAVLAAKRERGRSG